MIVVFRILNGNCLENIAVKQGCDLFQTDFLNKLVTINKVLTLRKSRNFIVTFYVVNF